MSAFVDTNILVRHLTGDPPDMAARASRFLAEERDLLLADLVASFDRSISRVNTVERVEPM